MGTCEYKLFPMSMNYSYNKKSYKNEHTNEWTCCIKMLNTCTLIAWWSSNAKHIAVGEENREKLKEQQNQHNKHHIKANDRKQMRNYLQEMLKSAGWLGNLEPNWEHLLAKTGAEHSMVWIIWEVLVNQGDLHGKGHLNCIQLKCRPKFHR